jgi:hypothetical protein
METPTEMEIVEGEYTERLTEFFETYLVKKEPPASLSQE